MVRYVEEGQFAGNAQGNDLARLYSKNPGAIPVDDFTQGDRERVLELLLSQERVVSLIYAKTFPVHNNNANSVLTNNNHSNSHILSNNGSSNNIDLTGILDSNLNEFPPSPTTGNGSPEGGRPGTGNAATKLPALPPAVTGTRLASR